VCGSSSTAAEAPWFPSKAVEELVLESAEDEFGKSDPGYNCRPSKCRLNKVQPAEGEEELLHRWKLHLCGYCSKGSCVSTTEDHSVVHDVTLSACLMF